MQQVNQQFNGGLVELKNGNFDLEDEHQSRRPSKLDNDALATKIKERPDMTTRELVESSKSRVHECLVSLWIHFPL